MRKVLLALLTSAAGAGVVHSYTSEERVPDGNTPPLFGQLESNTFRSDSDIVGEALILDREPLLRVDHVSDRGEELNRKILRRGLERAEFDRRHTLSSSPRTMTAESRLLPTGVAPVALTYLPEGAEEFPLVGYQVEPGENLLAFSPELFDRSGLRSGIRSRGQLATPAPTTSPLSESSAEKEFRIITAQLPVGYIGAPFDVALKTEGAKGDLVWSAGEIPKELQLDRISGSLTGTPTISGEFPIQFTVQDRSGARTSRELLLVVRDSPLFVTSSVLAKGQIGVPYQVTVTAQGGSPPYRWEIAGGALPAGLTFDPTSGSLSGMPEEVFNGVLRIAVKDSEGKSDTAELRLEVRSTDLDIVSAALADGFQGSVYRFPMVARGGVPPYQWSIISGTLPPGVALQGSGVITGEPESGGEFLVSLSVIDTSGERVDRSFLLRVQEREVTPTPEPSPVPTPDVIGGSGGVGTEVTPTPEPKSPPPSALFGVPSDGKVGLAWTNPSRGDFVGIVVVRSEDRYPENVDDGIVIYSGTATNCVDFDLRNDTTYFYGAFADYGAGEVSAASSAAQWSGVPLAIALQGKPDPFIDSVVTFRPLDPAGCFHCAQMPDVVLGPPQGGGDGDGSQDVVSLNARINSDATISPPYGGTITVEFTDNIVVNGPGVDFTIFENPFRLFGSDLYFVEPAVVEVSTDGLNFYRFPFDFVPHFDTDGRLNLFNPFSYPRGFAGVRAVYSKNFNPDPREPILSGGDPFDLSDLPGAELTWIRFIRITAVGDRWLTDGDGDVVRHSHEAPTWGASGVGNSGFDLDAVVAVNY